MISELVTEYPVDVSIDVADGNVDLYMAYIKKVEAEFLEEVDELLASLGLSHLKVRTA